MLETWQAKATLLDDLRTVFGRLIGRLAPTNPACRRGMWCSQVRHWERFAARAIDPPISRWTTWTTWTAYSPLFVEGSERRPCRLAGCLRSRWAKGRSSQWKASMHLRTLHARWDAAARKSRGNHHRKQNNPLEKEGRHGDGQWARLSTDVADFGDSKIRNERDGAHRRQRFCGRCPRWCGRWRTLVAKQT
jgi:hypothetical protein